MKNLKRKLIMPFMNWKRKKFLLAKIMLPEEIAQEEKYCHETMLLANKQNKKDIELEFKHKRDILRKVLKINA